VDGVLAGQFDFIFTRAGIANDNKADRTIAAALQLRADGAEGLLARRENSEATIDALCQPFDGLGAIKHEADAFCALLGADFEDDRIAWLQNRAELGDLLGKGDDFKS